MYNEFELNLTIKYGGHNITAKENREFVEEIIRAAYSTMTKYQMICYDKAASIRFNGDQIDE